jgi:hypothetical protein
MKQHHVGELGAWVESLAPWQIFGFGSFPKPRSLEQTARATEDFLARHLPDHAKGFYSCELHPGGHFGHMHCLLAGFKHWETKPAKSGLRFLLLEADGVDLFTLWRNRFGEMREGKFVGAFNSFTLIENMDNSSRYVSKACRYAAKEAFIWGENISQPFRQSDTVFESLVQDVFPGATVLHEPTDLASRQRAFGCLSGTVRHKP